MKNTKVNPAKASLVTALKDLFSQSKSIAVVDYKGLKVSQATELRRAVKKAGGRIVVTKNTLFSIATGIKDFRIDGPSAFVFSLTDEVAAIKALADFAKKNSLPTFKMGFLSDKVLTKEELLVLADLPAKEILIARVLGGLNSPVSGLVYNLNWNLSKLVRTLDAVRAKKVN